MARKPDPARGSREALSPEASPLWGLVLVLGEIAERVERRRAEEHAPEPGDGDVRRPPRQQGDA
ncbi:MAG: hypothetical protein M3Q71_21405 [Chloroflexota bacterium]|nr:hypothetical protein [Chloroflexota bacterium]